jgi:glycosyltransferase involved in cell wall biosynthesis
MDIGVVIPLYNGSRYIGRTIESVLSQSYPPSQIIVVDDFSEDNSLDVVKSFEKVTVYKNTAKGTQFARKFGWQQLDTPLVAFLDQDDIWYPTHLSLLHSLLEKFPDCPAAIASCVHFYSESNLVTPTPVLNYQQFSPWSSFPSNSISTASAGLIRSSALTSIGGWSTQFTRCVDFYTWLRLSSEHPLVRNYSPSVAHRQHRQSQGVAWRTEDSEVFISQVMAALKDAIPYRIAAYPDEADLLEKRFNLMAFIPNIVKALVSNDEALLAESALAFEHELSGESISFINSMSGFLLWVLYPYLEPDSSILNNLLKTWPPQARKSLQGIRSKIATSRILPRHLLAHPLDLQLWLLLLESSQRILAKFRRYSGDSPLKIAMSFFNERL